MELNPTPGIFPVGSDSKICCFPRPIKIVSFLSRSEDINISRLPNGFAPVLKISTHYSCVVICKRGNCLAGTHTTLKNTTIVHLLDGGLLMISEFEGRPSTSGHQQPSAPR